MREIGKRRERQENGDRVKERMRTYEKEKRKKKPEQKKNASETVVFRRKRNYKEANPRDANSMVVENVPRFHSHDLVSLIPFPSCLCYCAAFSGFYGAVILRIRPLVIRSYAFHCETFSINYETICTPT